LIQAKVYSILAEVSSRGSRQTFEVASGGEKPDPAGKHQYMKFHHLIALVHSTLRFILTKDQNTGFALKSVNQD
jgi:hypothetical protein